MISFHREENQVICYSVNPFLLKASLIMKTHRSPCQSTSPPHQWHKAGPLQREGYFNIFLHSFLTLLYTFQLILASMYALFLFFFLSIRQLQSPQSVRCFKAQLSYTSLVLFRDAGRCYMKRVPCYSYFPLVQESTPEHGIQENEVSVICS